MSYRTSLTERLIQILFKLVRRPLSRQELAREFGVDAKTIKRDLDALSREFQITEERRGREVFYSYADGYKFKPPVFSLEEITVLLIAQKAIEGIGIAAEGSFYAGQTASVLRKIRKSLPRSVKEQLESLSEVYGSAQMPEKSFGGKTDIIDCLASCAVRSQKIKIRYHALNTNVENERVIEPYAVYFDPDGATLKLIAFDPKHQDYRVFSIERIAKVIELAEKFIKNKKFNLKSYLDEHCFNGIHGKPITVHLKATGVTARIFAERKFHPSQKIVERKQKRGASVETITIEMRVASGRGLHRFILSYLPEIEVIAPLSLREEINEILRASLPNKETGKFSAKI